MQYDKGYVSPYMVSDREKMEATMENAYVLVTDQKITNIQEILPLLEQLVQANRALLIIAEDLENEVVSTLALNKLRGTFNVVATKAPGFGDNQKEMLQDIAIMTGAKFYSKDLNMELKDMQLSDLGTVKKIVVTKDNTTMIGGAGSKEDVAARVAEIEAQMENTTSDYDKKRMAERLGKLSNGVWDEGKSGVNPFEYNYLYIWYTGSSSVMGFLIEKHAVNRDIEVRDVLINKILE